MIHAVKLRTFVKTNCLHICLLYHLRCVLCTVCCSDVICFTNTAYTRSQQSRLRGVLISPFLKQVLLLEQKYGNRFSLLHHPVLVHLRGWLCILCLWGTTYCATLLKSTVLNKDRSASSEILAKWSQGYISWLLLKNHVPQPPTHVCPIGLKNVMRKNAPNQCDMDSYLPIFHLEGFSLFREPFCSQVQSEHYYWT